MKIYERPSLDIKIFDVEDVIMESGLNAANKDNTEFAKIDSTVTSANGVVFEW